MLVNEILTNVVPPVRATVSLVHAGRYLVNALGVVEILGKSGKKRDNQQFVISRVKKVFPNNNK